MCACVYAPAPPGWRMALCRQEEPLDRGSPWLPRLVDGHTRWQHKMVTQDGHTRWPHRRRNVAFARWAFARWILVAVLTSPLMLSPATHFRSSRGSITCPSSTCREHSIPTRRTTTVRRLSSPRTSRESLSRSSSPRWVLSCGRQAVECLQFREFLVMLLRTPQE